MELRARPTMTIIALTATSVFFAWELGQAALTSEIQGRRAKILLVEEPLLFWVSVCGRLFLVGLCVALSAYLLRFARR